MYERKTLQANFAPLPIEMDHQSLGKIFGERRRVTIYTSCLLYIERERSIGQRSALAAAHLSCNKISSFSSLEDNDQITRKSESKCSNVGIECPDNVNYGVRIDHNDNDNE